MAKRVYLSPSDQRRNTYAVGDTTEAIQCGRIAAVCKAALERSGGGLHPAGNRLLRQGLSGRLLYPAPGRGHRFLRIGGRGTDGADARHFRRG